MNPEAILKMLGLIGIDLTWVLALSGITALFKKTIPEVHRKVIPWYVKAFMPMIFGLILAFLVPDMTIKVGLVSGFFASIGYMGLKKPLFLQYSIDSMYEL